MSIKSALTLHRGEDVVLPFDIDEDITGWTLSLIISDTMEDSTPSLTVAGVITTAATGLCSVTLTAAQTAALALPVYQWELLRTNSGAKATLAYGTLTVLPRVGV
jgi:hypothetical protein